MIRQTAALFCAGLSLAIFQSPAQAMPALSDLAVTQVASMTPVRVSSECQTLSSASDCPVKHHGGHHGGHHMHHPHGPKKHKQGHHHHHH